MMKRSYQVHGIPVNETYARAHIDVAEVIERRPMSDAMSESRFLSANEREQQRLDTQAQLVALVKQLLNMTNEIDALRQRVSELETPQAEVDLVTQPREPF